MIYLYDNTYEGFLTAIFVSFRDTDALVFRSEKHIPPMLDYITVKTDSEKFERLQNGIKKSLSQTILRDTYLLYLSGAPEHATVCLKYLRFCFSKGKGARSLRYEDSVKNALNLRDKVMREYDRMLGLVRFDKTETGTYVAQLEPDNNILPLIAGHFAQRMPSHSFVIRDISRNIAMLSHMGSWVITELSPDVEFDFTGDEFRSMWKDYWQTMAIKERLNPRLQKQYMPKRYWKHLPEIS